MNSANPVVNFFKINLQGIGFCILNSNALTGLIILVGIAYSSWQGAVFFLLGAILGTVIAILLKAREELINLGLFAFAGGYSGVLVGTFIIDNVPHVTGQLLVLLLLGGVIVVPFTIGWFELFGKFNLSSTAMPVLTVFWLLLAGFLYVDIANNLPNATRVLQAVSETPTDAAYTWQTAVTGVLSAFGQPFLHGNPVTGAIVLLAILVNSRIMGLTGVLAGLLMVALNWLAGAPEHRVADGELIFNSMLTVMALAGFFLYLDYRSVIYALIGGAVAQMVYLAATQVLTPLGLPAMVAGFVITTAFFVLGAQGLATIEVIPLEKVSKPENSLLRDHQVPAEPPVS